MTTTLRPTEPLQRDADGARVTPLPGVREQPSRRRDTPRRRTPSSGRPSARIHELRIDEPDRGRGRGTVAALAAEEVVRGWGCDADRDVRSPPTPSAALRLDHGPRLRPTQPQHGARHSAPTPPELPAGSRGPPHDARPSTSPGSERAVRSYVAGPGSAAACPEAEARAKSERDHATFAAGRAAPPRARAVSVLEHEGDAGRHAVAGRRATDAAVRLRRRGRRARTGAGPRPYADAAGRGAGGRRRAPPHRPQRLRGQHPGRAALRVARLRDDDRTTSTRTCCSRTCAWRRERRGAAVRPPLLGQQPVGDLLDALAQPLLALAAVEPLAVDDVRRGAGHADRLALGLVGVDDQDVPAVDQGGVELLGVQAEFTRPPRPGTVLPYGPAPRRGRAPPRRTARPAPAPRPPRRPARRRRRACASPAGSAAAAAPAGRRSGRAARAGRRGRCGSRGTAVRTRRPGRAAGRAGEESFMGPVSQPAAPGTPTGT